MEDRSYPFPTFSGLLTAEHRKRMGAAVWEFLWCINKTTKEYIAETGELRGVVLGGKPIKAEEVSEELGIHPDTVKSNFRKLVLEGYLEMKRTPYGQVIEVRKSKKFFKRNGENVVSRQGEKTTSGQGENTLSEQGYDENALSPRENTLSGCGENTVSNKTLHLDLAVDLKEQQQQNAHVSFWEQNGGVLSPGSSEPERNTISALNAKAFDKVRFHFCKCAGIPELSAIDIAELQLLLSDGIKAETICSGIDEMFAQHKPKHQLDKIRTIKYCSGKIRDLHYLSQQPVVSRKSESNQNKRTQDKRIDPGVSSFIDQLKKAGI